MNKPWTEEDEEWLAKSLPAVTIDCWAARDELASTILSLLHERGLIK